MSLDAPVSQKTGDPVAVRRRANLVIGAEPEPLRALARVAVDGWRSALHAGPERVDVVLVPEIGPVHGGEEEAPATRGNALRQPAHVGPVLLLVEGRTRLPLLHEQDHDRQTEQRA